MIIPKSKICLTFDHDSEGAERIYSDALPDSRMRGLTPDKRQALLHPNNSANTLKPLHKASPI